VFLRPREGGKLILERMEVSAFASNCYLLGCPETREGFVIDPGSEGASIIKRLQELELAVKFIINTHGHIDHVGANAELKKEFAVPLVGHEADKTLYRSPQATLALFMGQGKLAPVDQAVREGDVLTAGTLDLKVLETPGHTPGGISLALKDGGAIFTGDTLFAGSIGRTDLPGGSFSQLIESIKTKILVYPDDTKVFPGHGPSTTVGEEKRYNPFLTRI